MSKLALTHIHTDIDGGFNRLVALLIGKEGCSDVCSNNWLSAARKSSLSISWVSESVNHTNALPAYHMRGVDIELR